LPLNEGAEKTAINARKRMILILFFILLLYVNNYGQR
jgi:hypothetical protein